MRNWKHVGLGWVLLLGSLGSLPGQRVAEMQLCERVVANEPLAPKAHFDQRERAYCWLYLEAGRVGQSVVVQWRWEGEVQHQEVLRIGDQTWRTHCYKTLYQPGRWEVQVRKRGGELLARRWITAGDTSQLIPRDQEADTAARQAPALPNLTPTPGMPVPAPLARKRGEEPPPLPPSRWLAPQPSTLQTRADVLIVMPDTSRTAQELWQALKVNFPQSDQLRKFWVMLPTETLPPIEQDWDELSSTIARYEKRIFYDLRAQNQPSYSSATRTYIIGQGQGADLAWALTQRYPDRFDGALLVNCDCGYYQRGSMEVQRQSGMRYVVAAPMSTPENGLDLLQTTLDRLARARVAHQALHSEALHELENMDERQLIEALRYLTNRE